MLYTVCHNSSAADVNGYTCLLGDFNLNGSFKVKRTAIDFSKGATVYGPKFSEKPTVQLWDVLNLLFVVAGLHAMICKSAFSLSFTTVCGAIVA